MNPGRAFLTAQTSFHWLFFQPFDLLTVVCIIGNKLLCGSRELTHLVPGNLRFKMRKGMIENLVGHTKGISLVRPWYEKHRAILMSRVQGVRSNIHTTKHKIDKQ